MTALEEIKKAVEAEIERVVQSVNEWDDRTSPDDYPEHLLITSEELADILRNFAETTLESLQRENEELVSRANEAVEAANALQLRTDAAEYDTRDLLMSFETVARMAEKGILSMDGGQASVEIRSLIPVRLRTTLASTGGEHNGN